MEFDLGPLLQGQMRIAKVRGADNSLIFGSTDFGWLTNIKENMGWEYFGVVGFDLGPFVQGQIRIAKVKTAYNSLIIAHRGLGW